MVLIVEVHPDPKNAASDGKQSLKPEIFAEMVKQVKAIAEAMGRRIAPIKKTRGSRMVNDMEDGFRLQTAKIAIVGLGLMGGSLALALKGKCAALYGINSQPRDA